MAGIKLKSGADFCNFQATRMCLQLDPADPTSDFGNGRIYFNTSSSVGSGKHVRIYDGEAFRSLAYFDEIDERLKLIEGSVDTSDLINNLADVQAFLKDIKESDGDLMTMLNGKLDKDGGKAKNLAIVGSGTSYLAFESTDGTSYGSLGISSAHEAKFWDGTGAYTLLHSGNIESYKSGDSAKLGGQTPSWVRTNGLRFGRVKTATSSDKADANADLAGGGMIYVYSGLGKNLITNSPSEMHYGHIWQIGSYGGDALDGQLAWDINHNSTEDVTRKLWWRARDSTNGWTYSKWHQIAFTDSNVASATKLEAKRKIWGREFDGTEDINAGAQMQLLYIKHRDGTTMSWFGRGSEVSDTIFVNVDGANGFAVNTNGAQRMLINSSGNVGIGTTDPQYKLDVKGEIRSSHKLLVGEGTTSTGIWTGSLYSGSLAATDIVIHGNKIVLNGINVGIGTLSPTEKLHVDGNLYVTGNIIADGEVSAGGAGTESGTGGGTSGGGDALIYSQEFTPSTQVVSIAHGLSATKGVIVQVWEQNADGQSWSVVLVDIEEVDSNNIKLNFGRTETTLHKVVVMG